MSALPQDIAAGTTDGIVIYAPDLVTSASIKSVHPAARTPTSEFATFFDNASDAQTMLNEKAAYLVEVNQAHIAIGVFDVIDIGGAIAIAPVVPCVRVIDNSVGLDVLTRCRSYAHDFDTDSYAVEAFG